MLAGLWALTGFYTIDAAERGIVLQFGRYTETTLPGLRWHWPWPIERVEKVNTNETMRWDYRGSMLTRDENIVIVDLVVQYRRSDPNEFLFNLRNPEDTLKDVTASAIREIIGKNELDFILTDGRAEIADQTHELLQNTLDAYGTGITVYEVNMQDANFPAEVEESVQDAIKAREDKERRILEAQTYSNDILPKARGAAARQREEAEAYKASAVANARGRSRPVSADSRRVREGAGGDARATLSRNARADSRELDQGRARYGRGRQQFALFAARPARAAARRRHDRTRQRHNERDPADAAARRAPICACAKRDSRGDMR